MSLKYKILALMVALSVVTDPAVSRGAERDKPDLIALAAVLVRDGHDTRALQLLRKVSKTDKTVDHKRRLTLLGLLASRGRRWAQALHHLNGAVALGATQPSLHLMRAQAMYQLGQGVEVVDALDAAGEAGQATPALWMLRSRAWRRVDRFQQALDALVLGAARFPASLPLLRERVLLLVKLGLNRDAATLGQLLVRRDDATVQDVVTVAEALRRGRDLNAAARLLESARLRYPEQRKIAVQLAGTWLAMGKTYAAAGVLEAAALRWPELTTEAAELWRRAGRLHRALRLNGRVPQQKKKVRQRLGLLVDLGRFTQATALAPRARRLDLLKDDTVRYALAFAFFQRRQLKQAERFLRGIRDVELFEQAASLRQAILACRSDTNQCP